MSVPVTKLSARKLKDLRSGDKITIWHKQDADTNVTGKKLLFESYPKNILTTFATKWEEEFPAPSMIKTKDILEIGAKKSLTIIGGNRIVYEDILKWMLASCEGKGLADVPIKPTKSFYYQYLLRKLSNEVGSDHLSKLANNQMMKIASVQIHSEDIKAMWPLPETVMNKEMKPFLADHVAVRFWEHRLKATPAYVALRKEFPDFDEAINNFCQAKQEECDEMHKAKKRERDEANYKIWKDNQDRQETERHMRWEENQRRREEARLRNGVDSGYGSVEGNTNEEQKPTTIKVQVVRKGTNGRSTLGKMNLHEVGVTKRGFIGRK